MSRCGVIPPAQSGEIIAAKATHVTIHIDGIEKLAREVLSSIQDGRLSIPDSGGSENRPHRDHPECVDWIFITDALNFCFWTIGDDTKWKVEGQTGYNALEAALHRAVKEGKNITDCNYYKDISKEQLSHLMRSDDEVTPIPMLEERVKVLHEIATILSEKYDNTFRNVVKKANNSAMELLKIVVTEFECFRDEVEYDGKILSFYKRAQILIADLWNTFDGRDWGRFVDIDKLTMFADYRVPQVLVHFGVLKYSDQLYNKLKKDELLESGSIEEIEIRGCSIRAVEMLRKRLREELPADQLPSSALLDYYLWCYRRLHNNQVSHIPFHKVMSIYY